MSEINSTQFVVKKKQKKVSNINQLHNVIMMPMILTHFKFLFNKELIISL